MTENKNIETDFDENILIQIEIAFNEEILAYQEMYKLYQEKQYYLVGGQFEELIKVDEKILENFETIKTLESQRVGIVHQLLDKDLTLSELIELAKDANKPIMTRLEQCKIKLNELARAMVLIENINVELIRHGLIVLFSLPPNNL